MSKLNLKKQALYIINAKVLIVQYEEWIWSVVIYISIGNK